MQQATVLERYQRMYKITVLLCLLISTTSVYAQDDNVVVVDGADSTLIDQDTFIERRNGMLDVFEGNPGTAAIRGLLIPAGGQIYNKRWWKVPLALGAEGAALGYLAWTYSRYSKWDNEYQTVVLGGGAPTTNLTQDDLILRARTTARSDREMAWVFWAVTHIFVAFEAYIDRHLIEFDVSDDLTFAPMQTGLGPVAGISYTIPLSTQKYLSKAPISIIP